MWRHKICTFLLEFHVLRHEHTRYDCCACIKEKQIVVTTEFVQIIVKLCYNELK